MEEFILATLATVAAVVTILWTEGRWAKGTGITLSLMLYIGALYLIQTSGQNWRLSSDHRTDLGRLAFEVTKKYRIPICWHRNDQSKNYAEEIMLVFRAAGWGERVGLDPRCDIRRNVQGLIVIYSNKDTEKPAGAIRLKKLFDDAKIPNQWGTEIAYQLGEFGLAVGNQPRWRVSNLWQ